MIYIVLAALIAVAVLWFIFPAFRVFIDGLKTRAIGVLVALSGFIGTIDPTILGKALALDARGMAWVGLITGLLILLARELTKKPGKLVKK